MSRSRVVTFYSYKGGVGRTAALANIGVLLAAGGKRVLMVDCDLEAPGLDRYFRSYISGSLPEACGMIHLLHDAARSSRAAWGFHARPIVLPGISKSNANPITVDLISSGVASPNYSELVSTFSWQKFFEIDSGGAVIERWRDEWKDAYDFILVDSRTGITDAGAFAQFSCLIFSPWCSLQTTRALKAESLSRVEPRLLAAIWQSSGRQ